MPPNIFKFARKLVKSQPCCKGVGHTIFCDSFQQLRVSWSNSPSPNRWCLGNSLPKMLLFLVRACLTVYLPILVFKRFLSEVPHVCPGLFPDSLQNDDVLFVKEGDVNKNKYPVCIWWHLSYFPFSIFQPYPPHGAQIGKRG